VLSIANAKFGRHFYDDLEMRGRKSRFPNPVTYKAHNAYASDVLIAFTLRRKRNKIYTQHIIHTHAAYDRIQKDD